MERNLTAFVITLSDRAYKRIYEDKSGMLIEKWLKKELNFYYVERIVIPDDEIFFKKTFKKFLKKQPHLIITTGGTGASPTDITPEVTEKFIMKKIPGIMEYLRYEGSKDTPFSYLSRGIAGIHKQTLIINLPGSIKAVENNLNSLKILLPHLLQSISGIENHS